jgi:MoaA/NifB/PqqE/SkfB family radical SAM enzyme
MLRVVGQTPQLDQAAPYLRTAESVRWGAGFFNEETENSRSFHWMGLSGRFEFEPSPETRFVEFSVFSDFHDLSQELTVSSDGESRTFALAEGWMQHSVIVPAGATACELALNKPFPRAFYPTDERTLGVRVREPLLHADGERHEHVARQHENARLNRREMLDRQVRLESTPPMLGIDMYGVCNVKPPCVYCEWDWNKQLEGEHVDSPFDLETLAEYGAFFDNSHQLINCSIGEPFMMKEFDALLETFGRQGKLLELTTNGQILTDRNIERLVGRSIDLYVSLDAGTPETYAKVRNDRFEPILENLKRLGKAKGGRGGLPRISLVFMPMAVNQHELEDFVTIAADLEVDRMVLRPLNDSDSINLTWERQEYKFYYQRELLPVKRLAEISAEAARLAAEHRVPLSDQMDFGGAPQSFAEAFDPAEEDGAQPIEYAGQSANDDSVPAQDPVRIQDQGSAQETGPQVVAPDPAADEPLPSLGAEREPICMEPWRSLYILRRGIMPCCYGGEPIGDFTSYREAWNGQEIVEIRESLAAGRFHGYCLNSPACPIVRKRQASGELPWHQRFMLVCRRYWFAFERSTEDGWRSVASWPIKKGVRFALAFRREPMATTKHAVRKLLGMKTESEL